MTQPKTASEALQLYFDTTKYAGDDPMVSSNEVYYLAHQVTELVAKEKLDLAALVPDDGERSSLIADADQGMKAVEDHQRFLEEMDDIIEESDEAASWRDFKSGTHDWDM